MVLPMVLGAMFFKLLFAAPGDSVPGVPGPQRTYGYEAERSPDHGNTWYTAGLFSAPNALASWPAPKPPGQPETLYVSISTAPERWLGGGDLVRLRSYDYAGNRAAWSNRVLVIAGPDTIWSLGERGPGGRMPTRGALAQAGALAAWQFAPDDTATAEAEHFELVQLREAARLCELYGYYVLRGVRIMCGSAR